MPVGSTFPSESITSREPRTGAIVRQVTNFQAIHHHPFYYIPAYNRRAQLFFISHRTGSPQLFMEDGRGGRLVQLTDRHDLNEWSCHPELAGDYVYYTAGSAGWRIDLRSLVEERIAEFGERIIRKPGMVGASMATTSLSTDGRWWCVFVKTNGGFHLHILDVKTGENSIILETDTIAHPQFHPDDPSLLRYAGPHHRRIWVIRSDGSDNRLVYERDDARKEWIVHETWLPGTREIIASNWPHGVMAVDIDTGEARWLARTNAWHPSVNLEGTRVVADTTHPDAGLVLMDPRRENDSVVNLCDSASSNEGKHWRCDHCPYDDGPVEVYAPQHTHPHPSFSAEGCHVVFTSDRTGYAQVYEVEISETFADSAPPPRGE